MKKMDKRKIARYECCDVRFTSSKSLGSHVATYHQYGLKCLKCDQVFNTPSRLRKHQITHLGKKEFVCNICKFATVYKHNAKRHFESHKREGNYSPSKNELIRQSRKNKKTPKTLIHKLCRSMTPGFEKIEPPDDDDFTEQNQRNDSSGKHLIVKLCRVSTNVQNHYKGKSGKRIKKEKSLISARTSGIKKIGNNSAFVGGRVAIVDTSYVYESHPLLELVGPSDLSTNSIQDEARQIRSQWSVVTAIPALLPLLERLLELLASITKRIPKAMDEEVRFEAIECLEYLLNSTRMFIVRWEDLTGQKDRDASLNAIQHAYGTLPLFINWEKDEHLEMLANIVLLILNTVKNRQSPPPIDMKSTLQRNRGRQQYQL